MTTMAEERAARYSKRRGVPRLVWPLAALGVILLFNFFFTPEFFRVTMRDGRLFGNVIDILRNGVPVTLVSIGMTLVIATGGVDLSVGAVMALAGTLAAVLIGLHHWGAAAGISAALGLALVCGVWNGFLVAYLGIQPIVATLVLMVSGRGIAQLLSGGQIVDVINPGFDYLTKGAILGMPFAVYLMAACFIVVAVMTRKTALGLFIESVGNNPLASRYAGINERGVKMVAYIVAGVCSGLAGMHVASEIQAADANNAGLYLELDAILAVLIGGTSLSGGRFSLIGSVVGAMIIQTTRTMILNKGIAVESTMIVKAVIILVIAIFQAEKFRTLLGRMLKRGRA
ncbi:MAG TPA: ABC transporter permease [Tepidisphaeraceae bacterium]|jgi:simple sugar transport system permease protein|nr:ABC transporter permease [Tepidisphaeraceae bacterium]